MRVQFIVLFTIVGALLAAIWRRIVSNVRDCSACRGFGIARRGALLTCMPCACTASLALVLSLRARAGADCAGAWAAWVGRGSSATTSRAQCAWAGGIQSASTVGGAGIEPSLPTRDEIPLHLQRACRKTMARWEPGRWKTDATGEGLSQV